MKYSSALGSLVAFGVVIVLALTAATALGVIRIDGLGGGMEILVVGVVGMVTVALLLLWFGSGVYVYRDARERGMEPVLWTVVVMLIPYFVGLVAYLVARQSRAGTCRQCGHGVPPDAAYCPHCAAPLRSQCPSCGHPLVPGAAYCPGCGARVDGASVGAEQA